MYFSWYYLVSQIVDPKGESQPLSQRVYSFGGKSAPARSLSSYISRVTRSCLGSLKQKLTIWYRFFNVISILRFLLKPSWQGKSSEFALPCLSRTLLETSMATSPQEQWADVLRPVLVYLVNWKGILTKGNLIHLL